MGEVGTEKDPREMSPALVREYLARFNASASQADVSIYADYFASYHKAAQNIAAHGDVCLHPRTGQPFANPYADVRDKAAAVLRKIPLKTGTLWNSAQVYLVAISAAQDAPSDAEFVPILAYDAEEAGSFAIEDAELTYPQTVWVKDDAGIPQKYSFTED